MKYLLLSLFCLVGAYATVAQKVKIKDEIASIDGEDYLQWKAMLLGAEISVYPLESDNEVIFIRYLDYPVQSTNPDAKTATKVTWYEIHFLELDLKCEVDGRTQKALVRLFYDNKLFQDGALNEANVRKFVSKYGTTFSDNRPGSVIIVTD